MGKIVKYCAACDESFAEKFGFCPNCGQPMSAFEMNPLKQDEITIKPNQVKAETPQTDNLEAKIPAPVIFETSPVLEEVPVTEVATASVAGETHPFFDDEFAFKAEEIEVLEGADIAEESQTFVADVDSNGNGNGNYNGNNFQSANYYEPEQGFQSVQSNDDYRITVIEEKNVGQRNLLLLGAFVLMTSLAIGGTIFSLFNRALFLGAIDSELSVPIPVTDAVPLDVEEPEKKDKDKGGGGGGGGREEETETSKGRLATQTEKPIIRPDVSIEQKDFELKQPVASTQGKKEIKPTDEKYGNPNASLTGILSNGRGKGGGQGEGSGDGQGTGRGSGTGSGIGSGFGGGNGDGEGDGKGPGDGTGKITAKVPPPPPPAPPTGVTEGLKITSKPKPPFTDTARQNQIQGVVRLRVTFLASGQIGSISPVQGLSGGLTEQAIAAAKNIRFEPAKRNGVPYTVVKQVEYNFTLY